MKNAESRRLLVSWLSLSVITLALWWSGSSRGDDALTRDAALTCGVMLIAALKVRVIVSYFMELRHAPSRLRRWMDGWLVFTIAALLTIYLLKLSIPPV